MHPQYTPKDVERFWSRVDRSGGPDACWPWTAARVRDGYGELKIGGLLLYAHRVAWELTYGPIPLDDKGETFHVLHDCPDGDMPACCNPAHFWLGDMAANMADKVAKGRQARGARVGPKKRRGGEACSWSRLTAEQVRAIRRRHAAGESYRHLAAELGVSVAAVGHVVRGTTWRHVA